MPAQLPAAATQVGADVIEAVVDAVLPHAAAHPWFAFAAGAVGVAHFLASAYVASTETKSTWWYKLLERIALQVGKAKDKAE